MGSPVGGDLISGQETGFGGGGGGGGVLNVVADVRLWEFIEHDYHSLVNSPGHVVYIFRREVEGFYLRMASLESAEREPGVYLSKCKNRYGDI